MKADIYNQKGEKAGNIELPESVFSAPWNGDLVHQVLLAMRANARTPVAHTKDRSEVRGGGKKPWKQKGTGRARHGSVRSPIWIGGGVTHGPRKEKDYGKKVNKKMRSRALYAVLSAKMRDGEILFLDNLTFTKAKTKQAKETLNTLAGIAGFEGLKTKRENAALILTVGKDDHAYKSFSNFSNIAIEEFRNLNTVDALKYKYLVIVHPKESIAFISGKLQGEDALSATPEKDKHIKTS